LDAGAIATAVRSEAQDERRSREQSLRAHTVNFGTPGDSRLPAYSVEKLVN
jgi:hypothetical protein